MDPLRDHELAKEYGRHRLAVDNIKRRAQQWRLMDCSEEALEKMRHALLEEMAALEESLTKADNQFLRYIEHGSPLETNSALQRINRLTAEWETLNDHLQDIDEALLQRHLQSRLIRLFGSARRLYVWDGLIFTFIVIIVALTVVELLFPLPTPAINWIIASDTVISFFLMGDFALRLFLSEDRGWYFRRYWIDLLASLPFSQFLRFESIVAISRFVRLLRLLRLGRAVRVLLFAFRGLDKLSRTFQLNLLKRAVLTAVALLFFGALTIGALEGGQGGTLLDLGESMWWSFATVVTGGFADLYNPTTFGGRVVTVGLVLLGLVVTSIFTASLTSVLVEDESSRLEQAQQTLQEEIAVINQQLNLLSGETNRGLIALEQVAQSLSHFNQKADIARVLADAMLEHFEGMAASVHLLRQDGSLQRLAAAGRLELLPETETAVTDGIIGTVLNRLKAYDTFTGVDLEPETEPAYREKGLIMVCPMVAAQQIIGVLYLVLPEHLGRFYLYNRAPMTLAHHAAMAFYAAHLHEANTA